MNRICSAVFLSCCLSFVFGCSHSFDSLSGRTRYPLTIAETRSIIEAQMDAKKIVGLSIALIDAETASDSRLIWAQGFGLADKATGKKASAETVYCIGSSSKTITAVALLKQKDEGKIDLDQPLRNYIPDFSLQVRYADIGQNDRITPRTLLDMHAGVPGDLYNGLFILSAPWYQKYMHWLLAYLQTDYPSHPPGALASYSNIGIVLVGHAAYLSGRNEADTNFQNFVKRTVFDPLGMRSSLSEVLGKDLPNLAVPYVQGVADEPFNSNGTATGGFYSTVKDMGRFISMLLMDGMLENGERFLQAATVQEMGKHQKTELDTNSYFQPGLGLDSVSLPAFYGVAPDHDLYGRAWAKNGSTGPYNAMIMLLPDIGLKLGVVVLSNSDTADEAVYAIARFCLLAAVREKLGLDRNPAPKPLPDFSAEAIIRPSDIAGLYGTKSPAAYFSIEIRDNRLFWITNPCQGATECLALTLKPDGSNAFAVEGKEWDVVFVDREDIHGARYRFMVRTGGEDERLGPNVVWTLGQKTEPPDNLDRAWRDRVGKVYVADQILEFSTDPYLTFALSDNLLLARTPSTMTVIHPQNDHLAWAGDTMNRGDGAVTATREADGERLYYLASGYFPIEQVKGYTLGDAEVFDLVLRNDIPLSVWRRITVTSGSGFEGRNVRFSATPGNDRDVYFIYRENLELLSFHPGKNGAVFKLDAGTYYFALSMGAEASGERVLDSRIAD